MGLRINYNGAAANAWRNLGVTDSKLSGSVEKLSSGLRINKGADDPAGLIISERLKAQISGLGQAIRNAQEATSLVQTAEGALTEMNNMLVKMRALAVHSANAGVNDTDTIAADQRQIDSALDSLQKIAENTKYQSKVLLDGSAANTALLAPAQVIGGTAGTPGVAANVASLDPKLSSVTLAGDTSHLTSTNIELDITSVTAHAPGAITLTHMGTSADQTNLDFTRLFAGGGGGGGGFSPIWVAGTDIATKVTSIKTLGANEGWVDGVDWTVTTDGIDTITITMADINPHKGECLKVRSWDGAIGGTGVTFNNYYGSENLLQGQLIPEINNVATPLAVIGGANYAFSALGAPLTPQQTALTAMFNDSTLLTVDSGAAAFAGTTITLAPGEDVIQNITNAIITTPDSIGTPGSSGTSVQPIESLEVKGDATEITGTLDLQVTRAAERATVTGSGFAATHGAGAITINSSDYDEVQISIADNQSLNSVVDTLNQYYSQTGVWASTATGQLAFTFNEYGERHDITISADAADVLAAGAAASLYDKGVDAAGNLIATVDGSTATLSMSGDGLILTVEEGQAALVGTAVALTGADASDATQRSGAGSSINGNSIATYGDAFSIQAGGLSFSLGQDANASEIRTLAIDNMQITELGGGVSSLSATTSLNSLRAGETYALANDAANAVKIIDQAIDDVSITRATLGAFQQNALETTILTLSINKENLEASNSRIADVDMAQEMMEFTKNQILVQAGTAMLAQANQLPQAVLQLLG